VNQLTPDYSRPTFIHIRTTFILALNSSQLRGLQKIGIKVIKIARKLILRTNRILTVRTYQIKILVTKVRKTSIVEVYTKLPSTN
jgi:hypothetical protein